MEEEYEEEEKVSVVWEVRPVIEEVETVVAEVMVQVVAVAAVAVALQMRRHHRF